MHLVVPPPPAGPGAGVGPAARLGAHAHCPINGGHRGQEGAPPQLRDKNLKIPPYNRLAACKSCMALERGRNLRAMMELYTAGPETSHAGTLGGGSRSVISMVVLEDRQYYQVKTTAQPQARR